MIQNVYGSGHPRIAIVACMHGDEQCGLAVFDALKQYELKGVVTCILANPEALAQGKRFIDEDMNKCFPGGNGTYEKHHAQIVFQETSESDIVIDLHATSQCRTSFVILTKKSSEHKELARATGVKHVVLMSPVLKQGRALIDHHKLGISVECGIKNSTHSAKNAVRIVQNILGRYGLLKQGSKKKEPIWYNVTGSIHASLRAIPLPGIYDFQLVASGTALAMNSEGVVTAQEAFYPVFFGEQAYRPDGILCLTLQKTNPDA